MLKGTALYEMYSLVGYWYKTLSKKTENQVITKYCFGSDSKQYFILYDPIEVDPSKPLIVYYHGGGWLFGNPELFAKKAAIFNKLGYQIIIPCYRKIPRYTYTDMREDLNLTLSKIQALNKEGILNFDKIILGGTSAGGTLASLIYYQKEYLAAYGFKQEDFSGLFLTAPPLDLTKMTSSPVLYFFAGRRSSKKFRDASPLNWLKDAKPIKTLCIHGTKDGLVNYEASESFFNDFENIHPTFLKKIKLAEYGHIESASWAHTNNFLRDEILNFIKSCH